MDTFVLITLIVILLLFIYFLYYWVYSTKKVLTNAVVNLSSPAITALSDLKEPGNTRYAYGAWVFVNDLSTTASNVIFYRKDNICVYFEKNSALLKCSIDGTGATATTITDTFPLQRWVHILVSVDGQYIDYYLNGKLIKSEKKTYIPKTPAGYGSDKTTVTNPVYLGNSGIAVIGSGNNKDNIYPTSPNSAGYNAFLTKFTRWTNPLDPQSVWNEYTSGNGGAYFPYSVRLDLLKNNNVESTYQMW